MSGLLDSVTQRLVALHGLEEALARAVVAEVVDAFDLTVDDFVTRRHAELKRGGLSNESIFSRVRQELAVWRFRAPELSERQLRRRIYG